MYVEEKWVLRYVCKQEANRNEFVAWNVDRVINIVNVKPQTRWLDDEQIKHTTFTLSHKRITFST